MAVVISSWTVKTSLMSRSYRSAQMWLPVSASTSCAATRTLPPLRARCLPPRNARLIRVQFASHRRDGLVGKAGIAGDHEKLTITRKLRYNVLGNAIGEVLLLWIATHVGKGEHGDRGLIR